tara:strand:+ start:2002 stop:2343 length:342 start_codon:yes stop_codon:yes gene_type:complete
MAEEIKLTKNVYGKVTYPNIINTEFTQLIGSSQIVEDVPITIEQLFGAYDNLFFEIPISGDFNSHEELIKRSTEYSGTSGTTDEVEALLDEINQLRIENLSLQQTIDGLTTSK